MSSIRIAVGDEYVDLYEKSTIQTTYQSLPVGDIGKRLVTYTNRFTVPATEKNDRIFSLARVVTSQSSAPYVRRDARLDRSVGSIPGQVIVTKATRKDYEIQFLESSKNFHDLIQGKTLAAVDTSSIDPNSGTTLSGWKSYLDGIRANTTGALAAVMDHGKFPGPSGGNFALNGVIEYYYPSVYLSYVLDKVITAAGYTKSGTVFDTDEYKKSILPFSSKKLGPNDNWRKSRSFSARKESSQSRTFSATSETEKVTFTTLVFAGESTYWDGIDDYDVPTLNHRFSVMFAAELLVDVTLSGGATLSFEIYDGAIIINQSVSSTGTYRITLTWPSREYGSIAAAAHVRVRCTAIGTGASVTVHNGFFSLDVVDDFGYLGIGSRILGQQSYSMWLPQLTQSQFIREFLVHFGLEMYEFGGVLYFRSLAEIIDGRANVIDWTTLRDGADESLTFTSSNYGQKTLLRYSPIDGVEDFVGDGYFEIENDQLAQEKVYFQSMFNKTKDSTLNNAGTQTDLMMAHVLIYDAASSDYNAFDFDPGMRILMVRNSDQNTVAELPVIFNATLRTDYLVAYFTKAKNNLPRMDFQYLLKKFYGGFIESTKQMKVVTRRYRLTDLDVMRINPTVLIFDRDSYYKVEKVKYTPGQSAEVTLFKTV